jgi:insecticidal toxin complex protein TccC
MFAATSHDTATPKLSVIDSRGLAVRVVDYCRQRAEQIIESRIDRQVFDPAGRMIAQWDPRLWGSAAKPNIATLFSLSGKTLSSDSVDSGWALSLLNAASHPVSNWDSRGSQSHVALDPLQRPVAVTQYLTDQPPQVVERLTYGDACASDNLRGRLVRHDHPAGTLQHCAFTVTGQSLIEQTRFLIDLTTPDWPMEMAAREVQLESEAFTTCHSYNAVGDVIDQTDAMGNRKLFAYTRAGEQKEARLKLASVENKSVLLVSDIGYNASGQVTHETAGNGAKTSHEYSLEDGRPIRLCVRDPAGITLQDLNFVYDPVGNILSIDDKSRLTGYFKNRRSEPINRYRYDSLYQLVEATGREVSQPDHGPSLPVWRSPAIDPNQLLPYTQTFEYDMAGNLIARHHSGAETFTMFTGLDSNRSVPRKEDLSDAFDANGNQLELQRGQRMSWDARNQLSLITMVKREHGADDDERYIYDNPGSRARKVRMLQTGTRSLRSETRYLPGLEIHRNAATGEDRQVINVEAGACQVRALHWVAGRPAQIANDQLRYSVKDHLGSVSLELDDQAQLLSQEGYYPCGGTAWWAGASAVEVKYKTLRYSGKERDATGLYFYGFRYYAPWLQRWISPDPAGAIDGTNQYLMVSNNPVNRTDSEGLVGEKKTNLTIERLKAWENLPPNLMLVHTLVDKTHGRDSELLRRNADEVMSSWDAISTSLINLNDRKTKRVKTVALQKAFKIDPLKVHDTYSVSERITLREIALKLTVKPSNIILLSAADLGFRNHIGTKRDPVYGRYHWRAGALAEHVNEQLNQPGESLSPKRILSPSELIKAQHDDLALDPLDPLDSPHNEVIITGRKDVSIHTNYPASKPVTVEKIFVLPNDPVLQRAEDGQLVPVLPSYLQKAVDQLKKLNPGIPVEIR